MVSSHRSIAKVRIETEYATVYDDNDISEKVNQPNVKAQNGNERETVETGISGEQN